MSRKSASWIIASHYANILFVLLSQNCHSFAPCYFGLGSLALTRCPTQNPLLTRSRLTGTPPFSADSSSPCERLRPQLARASWIIRVRIAFASSLLIFVTLKLALKQGYLLRRVSFTLFTSLPLTKQLLIVLLGRVENPRLGLLLHTTLTFFSFCCRKTVIHSLRATSGWVRLRSHGALRKIRFLLARV